MFIPKMGGSFHTIFDTIFWVVVSFFSTTANHLPPNMCWVLLVTNPGGGFKHFLFSSLFGEMIQFDSYFSDGLVQPPTSNFLDRTSRVHVSYDLLHIVSGAHCYRETCATGNSGTTSRGADIFQRIFNLLDLGGVSLGLFVVNFDRYISLGCGPFPGCQWQIKVYRDSLRKME